MALPVTKVSNQCPYCGVHHECASPTIGDVKPSAGAVSICIQCGEASIFTEDLNLRLPTGEEKIDLACQKTDPSSKEGKLTR